MKLSLCFEHTHLNLDSTKPLDRLTPHPRLTHFDAPFHPVPDLYEFY